MTNGRNTAERALRRCMVTHPPADSGERIPQRHPCRELYRQVSREASWVTAGGPLSNMLIGSLGFGLSLSLPTALAGLALMSIVTFRYIPRAQRLPFILAGLAGGALCVWVWLDVVGQQLAG